MKSSNIWFSLVYKLDKIILEKSSQIYRKIVLYLSTRAPGCLVHMFLLPLPTTYGQHSLVRGGNMLGLERLKVWRRKTGLKSLELGIEKASIGVC